MLFFPPQVQLGCFPCFQMSFGATDLFPPGTNKTGTTPTPAPSKNRLVDVLSLTSIAEKCKEIDKYLNEARYDAREDYRELLEAFPSLMVNMFGFGDSESRR